MGEGDSYMCSSFGPDFVLLLVIFTVLPKGAVFATCVNEFAKLSILQKMIDMYEVSSITFCLSVRPSFTNITCTPTMNRMAKKTIIAQSADSAKMPVTFLDSLFRNFCVNIISNIYIFNPLLMFVGSFFNHPV